ncbi:hypothetical protein ACIRG5_21395 [Lentzea sp. NPDC102401]|uniref:hypothetical protein n=1 Tax=Lentzea sp. NPDC102401 TaxID=3364128 RepID=UPI0037FF709A
MPLAVSPMLLKNNRRVAALITVICLVLLVFEALVRLRLIPPSTGSQGFLNHHHSKPGCWTCSVSTPPGHDDQTTPHSTITPS